MTAVVKNLLVDQGATFSVELAAVDEANVAIVGTEWTANAAAREHYGSASVSMTFSCVVSNGAVTISLSPSDTASLEAGRYVYDAKITSVANGDVLRVAEGILTLDPAVT